jgi:hypothetical protein
MLVHKLRTSKPFVADIAVVLDTFFDLLAFVHTKLVFHFIQYLIISGVGNQLRTSFDYFCRCIYIICLKLQIGFI